MPVTNKLKIFNDPIYGFITIPNTLIFDIIEHPYFQRLRRISQMGLSNLVYPGAHHTRFHHALGCMHLMQKTVNVLRFKGIKISESEAQSLYLAILLHDLGHGPFSHASEGFFLPNISHEDLSLAYMKDLNKEFNGALTEAIAIFTNTHKRKFFYQLISGQLDMDRLDYLKRDSFYTGVVEGSINSDRLIAMLHVKNDELVIEQKGVYSIEKFLLSRRFMYWQVYLHKTGLLAEQILVRILQRARELYTAHIDIKASKSLLYFIEERQIQKEKIDIHLDMFTNIDDYDVWAAVKEWQQHDDHVLSSLSKMIVQRKLPRIEMSDHKFSNEYLNEIKEKTNKLPGINNSNLDYFIFKGEISNQAYNTNDGAIKVLLKDGTVKEWLSLDTQFKTSALSKPNKKYFVAYSKKINIE